MLGKRPRTMRRTSSVSRIGSGSVNGHGSPMPDHPKEKQKSSNHASSTVCHTAARQVIGFHPKVFIDEELDLFAPVSPQGASPQRSSKSPSGSPRSGLGDLLAGSRPWDRKEERVGLGILAALSGSQEEICKEREDCRGYSSSGVYGSRKTSPQPHSHVPSVFGPSQGNPPIPIHPTSVHRGSGQHSPSHCPGQNCCTSVAFELAPSFRPNSNFYESSGHEAGRGVVRPGMSSDAGGPWSWSNASGGAAVHWSQQADMEVDRTELIAIAPSAHLVYANRQNLPSSVGCTQNFLDACHLCRRRLGDGRDIYIYRGDKAFCSPECRHQQILSDERPEKCSAAVMKVRGGSDVRSNSQRSRVAGTAAAA